MKASSTRKSDDGALKMENGKHKLRRIFSIFHPPFSIVALTLALAAGCAVGPNYHPPQANAPAQWSSPLAGGETNTPAKLAGWWRHFNDSNLDFLMTLAVSSNLDLRIAKARVREARAERDVASGSFWPSADDTAGYSRNRWGGNSFPPVSAGIPLDYNLYNAGFDAAWELDLFGGTRRAVEAANAEIGAAVYDQRGVLISLLGEVARNYIIARGYQQRLGITRENIEVQKDILDLTQSRYQSGLGSDLEVQQSTALLAATENVKSPPSTTVPPTGSLTISGGTATGS